MDKGDMRVGRVVAAWKDSDNGGIPPVYDSIPSNDHETFDSLARFLFCHIRAKYSESFLRVQMVSVVTYYNTIENQWKIRSKTTPCHIHEILCHALTAVGGDVSLLEKWSRLIYDSWLIVNLAWLQHEQLSLLSQDANMKSSVSVFTFEETLNKLVAGHHETMKRLAQ